MGRRGRNENGTTYSGWMGARSTPVTTTSSNSSAICMALQMRCKITIPMEECAQKDDDEKGE